MVAPAAHLFDAPPLPAPPADGVPYSDELAQYEVAQREAFGEHAAFASHPSSSKSAWADLLGRCSLMSADVLAAAGALMVMVTISGLITPDVADALVVLIIIPVCKVLGLYDRDVDVLHKRTFDEAPRLLCAAMIVTTTTITLRNYVSAGTGQVATGQLALMSVVMFTTLFAGRLLARRIVRGITPAERILMVGNASDCRRLSNAIASTPGLKAEIVCHMSSEDEPGINGLPRAIDSPDKLQLTLSGMDIHRVVIGTSGTKRAKLDTVIRAISATGTKVSLQPHLFGSARGVPVVEEFGAVKLVNLRQPRLSPTAKKTKRLLDVVGATVVGILAAPLFAAIAVAIKLDSRGPVFYRQKRIGLGGQEFEIVKFRTMRTGAESEKAQLLHLNETAGLFKISEDPRVTRMGKLLRKTSIDELPQLINVIRGQMSLVGPRPLVPEEDREIVGWRRHRNTITPGMTGVWQLLGPVRIPMNEMVEIDYEYVANWSLGTDIKILLQTVPHVLGRRGL